MSEDTEYYGGTINAARFVDEDHDRGTVAYHLQLVEEGCLAETTVARTWQGEVIGMSIGPLLWEGLRFTNMLALPTVWESVKERLDQVDGDVPYETLMAWADAACDKIPKPNVLMGWPGEGAYEPDW